MLTLIFKIFKLRKKDRVYLEYSRGGIGHTEESLSKCIKESYQSLAPLVKMQDRLVKVKKEMSIVNKSE